ncbi:MAG: aminotransferase class V-fold PLP-dependent enzyme [Cyclobacteriaceae bacterium]
MMKDANFYPGPSRVYSNITEFIYEANMEGILSINHRSDAFMDLMKLTKAELRAKLLIPEDYEIIFTSSATESWEIIAQSLTRKKSQHFYNGSFGEKWASYASKITETYNSHFGINEVLPTGDLDQEADVLCVTQNETSNATQVTMNSLKMLRVENEGKLIACDVTSSIGGALIDFELADVWYASVQKCLGLPAGLGLMILSPQAVQVAQKLNRRKHYNSLPWILDNARKYQTAYTPNVLGIYLLYRTQQSAKGIKYISNKLNSRLSQYETLFEGTAGIDFLITNKSVRSETVLALQSNEVDEIKGRCTESGITLGNGYGPWKSNTFRIANFPAIKSREVEKLYKFFEKNY